MRHVVFLVAAGVEESNRRQSSETRACRVCVRACVRARWNETLNIVQCQPLRHRKETGSRWLRCWPSKESIASMSPALEIMWATKIRLRQFSHSISVSSSTNTCLVRAKMARWGASDLRSADHEMMSVSFATPQHARNQTLQEQPQLTRHTSCR